MGSVGVRISWDVDTTDRLLHPVGVSEMKAALKAALEFWEMRADVEEKERKIEARLDRVPPVSMGDCFQGQ